MIKRPTISALLLAAFLTSVPLIADDKPPEVSHDGLHLVPGTEVAAAWVKPGADFSGYQKIMLLDAAVAFRKNWALEKNRGSLHRITSRDVERIKRMMWISLKSSRRSRSFTQWAAVPK